MAFSLRVPSASARVPDVRKGVRPPAGSGTPRCGCGGGWPGAPSSVDATKLDPHLVLHLQLKLHKLYELVVASYLKNGAS